MTLKHLAVGAAVYVALLIAAPVGIAATAAQTGYSEPAGSVQQRVAPNNRGADTHAATNDSGSLPFTGLDLGLVAGAGGMLLAVGLAVRRLVGEATP